MSDNNRDTVQGLLNKASSFTGGNDSQRIEKRPCSDILEVLQEARQAAGNDEDLLERIDNREQQLLHNRRSDIMRQLQFIEQNLQTTQTNDDVQTELNRLHETERLLCDDRHRDLLNQLESLRDRANRIRYERQMADELQTLRDDVEAMWDEAHREESQANLAFNKIRAKYYLAAIEKVEAAYNRWKETLGHLTSPVLQELEDLLEEVRRRDSEARNRAEVLTTALQEKRYLELLQELRDIQEYEPGRLVQMRDERGRAMDPLSKPPSKRSKI
jgi:hypothetical protein